MLSRCKQSRTGTLKSSPQGPKSYQDFCPTRWKSLSIRLFKSRFSTREDRKPGWIMTLRDWILTPLSKTKLLYGTTVIHQVTPIPPEFKDHNFRILGVCVDLKMFFFFKYSCFVDNVSPSNSTLRNFIFHLMLSH